MKKICITGCSGLLGGNLSYLLSNRYKVYGLDKVRIEIPNMNYIHINLLDKLNLITEIERIQPDVMIHCAAAVEIDKCEKNKQLAKVLNIDLTRDLAEICNRYKIKLIYISSDAVFDGKKLGFYSEEDIPNPINYYGVTKLQSEQEVLKYADNVVLRTNIYGYNMQSKSSLGEWIINSLKQNKTLTMFKDVIFSPLLVNEASFLIGKIIEKDLKGLYHFCSTGRISKYKFGLSIKNMFNIQKGKIIPICVDEYGFVAKRGKNISMDNKKLSRDLNIDIQTIDEGITQFSNLYKSKYDEKIKSFIV